VLREVGLVRTARQASNACTASTPAAATGSRVDRRVRAVLDESFDRLDEYVQDLKQARQEE